MTADQFITANASLLAQSVRETVGALLPADAPTHLGIADLLRQPYAAQSRAITAAALVLEQDRSVILACECGTGKTIMALGTVWCHAQGTFRAILYAPGHLLSKWRREIRQTIPGARVRTIKDWKDAYKLRKLKAPPCPAFYLLARDRGKLGPAPNAPRRRSPAKILRKHCKGVFDYAILDEIQEHREESQQSRAGRAVAEIARYRVLLTGTLSGSRPAAFRGILRGVGGGHSTTEPSQVGNDLVAGSYGCIKTTITETSVWTGKGPKVIKRDRQETQDHGLMPWFFADHLLHGIVRLGLADLAQHLPTFECIKVPVSAAGSSSPQVVAMAGMTEGAQLGNWLAHAQRGSGAWMRSLYAPDFRDGSPKAQALAAIVLENKDRGRQCWVYLNTTKKERLPQRLQEFLEAMGIRVAVLDARVKLEQREAWISQHGPMADIVISHPKLVQTGMDLFDKQGKHNFSTLIWYQTNFQTDLVRQASRRAYRLGQTKPCLVYFLYHAATTQEKADQLLERKIRAAQELDC